MITHLLLPRAATAALVAALISAAGAQIVLEDFSGQAPTAGGSTILVEGGPFEAGAVTVLLGSQSITPFSVSASSLKFTLPAGEGTGLPLRVQTATETSNTLNFKYDLPAIDVIDPARGLVSDDTSQIQLTGRNFGFNPTVTFGSAPATVVFSDHETIVVTKPLTPVGDTPVQVVVAGQQIAAPSFFSSVDLTSLPGYYVDLALEQVLPAPPGRYAPFANMTAALECPPGKYTPIAGMQAPLDASPGYFVPDSGSSTQTPAPAGSIAPGRGNMEAIPASAGRYAPVAGMAQALPSPPGSFVSTTGATQPEPAPLGRYAPTPGLTVCIDAAAGTYVPHTGMTSALPASPGYFVVGQGSAEQVPSPPGRFVATAGSTRATVAPAGTYAPIQGMHAAIAAPEGTYSPMPGATRVERVPAGFTTSGEGSSELIPLAQLAIIAYTLEENGDNTLVFETATDQNYGIFYTENLIDYTLLEFVPGTGDQVSRTFTPPASATGKRFYVVGPAEAP